MCKVCDTAERTFNRLKASGDAAGPVMKLVEAAIKKGTKPEHFKPLLDKVLGTEMEIRDPELDAAWEKGYRK